MSTPLVRYLPWRAADFMVERGFPILIVNALFIFELWISLQPARGRPRAPMDADAGVAILISLAGIIAFVGTLLAVNGLVSTDRKQGYFRFLFAKPISLPLYYAQGFAVSGVGTVACGMAFFAAFRLLIAPVLPMGALWLLVLYFVAAGGIGFLLSVVSRYDWLSLAAVWVLSQAARRSISPERFPALARVLHVVLPPTHLADLLTPALLRGEAVDVLTVLWFAGYGLAAFAIGLIVLRRRPLTL